MDEPRLAVLTAVPRCADAGVYLVKGGDSFFDGRQSMHSSDSEMRNQDAGFDDDREGDPGEQLEAEIERADYAFGSESFGTTVEEELRGESLDQRLAEERPSAAPVETAYVIEDADEPDVESELIGEASLEHDPFLAPEEAAVHVRNEDPRQNG